MTAFVIDWTALYMRGGKRDMLERLEGGSVHVELRRSIRAYKGSPSIHDRLLFEIKVGGRAIVTFEIIAQEMIDILSNPPSEGDTYTYRLPATKNMGAEEFESYLAPHIREANLKYRRGAK